jgi:hypothetical protein
MATAVNMSGQVLMPKASAVWLIDNTVLTFGQIANFCGLTEIEVEALANQDIGRGLVGRNPIDHKELTQEELDRCQADPNAQLQVLKSSLPPVKSRAKGPRYTPVSKRGDKPDAIAYIIKNNPEITDAQIVKLVGTTKPTIQSIRDRAHPNTPNLKPRHPAELGLCTWQEYEKSVEKCLKAIGKDPEAVKAERLAQQQAVIDASAPAQDEGDYGTQRTGGFDFSNFLSDAPVTTSLDDKSDD